jgi:hypothetical protein
VREFGLTTRLARLAAVLIADFAAFFTAFFAVFFLVVAIRWAILVRSLSQCKRNYKSGHLVRPHRICANHMI